MATFGKKDSVFILVTMPDRPLQVYQFMLYPNATPKDKGPMRKATPENVEADLNEYGLGHWTKWRIVPEEDVRHAGETIRADREFWVDNGKAIVVGKRPKRA